MCNNGIKKLVSIIRISVMAQLKQEMNV